jgi:hypothetical protein
LILITFATAPGNGEVDAALEKIIVYLITAKLDFTKVKPTIVTQRLPIKIAKTFRYFQKIQI